MDIFGKGVWACSATEEDSMKDDFFGDVIHKVDPSPWGVITPPGILAEGKRDFGAIGSEVKLVKKKLAERAPVFLFGGGSEKKEVGHGAGQRFGDVWEGFRCAAENHNLSFGLSALSTMGGEGPKAPLLVQEPVEFKWAWNEDAASPVSGSDSKSWMASSTSCSSVSSSPQAEGIAAVEKSRDRGRSSYRAPRVKKNQADMQDFINTYGYGQGSEHPNNMIRPRKGKYFKEFEF